MRSRFLRALIRGVILLGVLVVFTRAVDAQGVAGRNREDSRMTSAQPRGRQARGFRPGNLQTARDFGKRFDPIVELGDLHFDRDSKRLPIHWILERPSRHPRITKEYQRILLNANDREDLETWLLLENIKVV